MSDEGSRDQHGESAGGTLAADGPRRHCVLTINGGSSSLKFAVFAASEPLERLLTGCVERVGRGRSRLVVREADGGRLEDGAVAAPDQAAAGGIGTVLEMMMVWQLLQVRKLHDTPLILAGAMWTDLVEWARRAMLRPDAPLASPEDFGIPICCQTGPEVLDMLREHHGRWKANQEATS
jgi:hypothetical protein